jgi:hypothetical protein
VKRHRASRSLVRVEVEVPSLDDAAAVRRFAQERRRHPSRLHPPSQIAEEARGQGAETLKAIMPVLSPEALEALRVFALGLKLGQAPGMIARAQRVAANFLDAAEMQGRAVRILETGNASDE